MRRKATVRDLRYRFSEVEDMLREGREIIITKRRKVLGRLVPERRTAPKRWPDFVARLKRIYGNKKLKVTGAEIIAQDRDRY